MTRSSVSNTYQSGPPFSTFLKRKEEITKLIKGKRSIVMSIDKILTSLEQRAKQHKDYVNQYWTTITQIDRTLYLLDQILNKTQPPLNGKIRIYWKHYIGSSDIRCYSPYLVKWIITPQKRWRLNIIKARPDRAVVRKNAFQLHYNEVVGMVTLAQHLIKKRKIMTTYSGEMLGAINGLSAFTSHAYIKRISELVDNINKKGIVQIESLVSTKEFISKATDNSNSTELFNPETYYIKQNQNEWQNILKTLEDQDSNPSIENTTIISDSILEELFIITDNFEEDD